MKVGKLFLTLRIDPSCAVRPLTTDFAADLVGCSRHAAAGGIDPSGPIRKLKKALAHNGPLEMTVL